MELHMYSIMIYPMNLRVTYIVLEERLEPDVQALPTGSVIIQNQAI